MYVCVYYWLVGWVEAIRLWCMVMILGAYIDTSQLTSQFISFSRNSGPLTSSPVISPSSNEFHRLLRSLSVANKSEAHWLPRYDGNLSGTDISARDATGFFTTMVYVILAFFYSNDCRSQVVFRRLAQISGFEQFHVIYALRTHAVTLDWNTTSIHRLYV